MVCSIHSFEMNVKCKSKNGQTGYSMQCKHTAAKCAKPNILKMEMYVKVNNEI